MLALCRDHVASAELLINHALDGAVAVAGSAGKWFSTLDKQRLSALCWATLNHPQTAAPYTALRMADAHALQKFLRVSEHDLCYDSSD